MGMCLWSYGEEQRMKDYVDGIFFSLDRRVIRVTSHVRHDRELGNWKSKESKHLAMSIVRRVNRTFVRGRVRIRKELNATTVSTCRHCSHFFLLSALSTLFVFCTLIYRTMPCSPLTFECHFSSRFGGRVEIRCVKRLITS